jgi:hypothetical protein
VIISFRGTEQVKFKDILTDINMMMDSYEDTNKVLSKITVHKGFMDAFRSVLCSLLMPYWTSLCVLRRTCRQSSLYETLFHCNTLSKHHHYQVGAGSVIASITYPSYSPLRGAGSPTYIHIYMYICINK